jgi:phage repressor protein C with HTH and peptisase S24 domain
MIPTLHHGEIVLVDLPGGRRRPWHRRAPRWHGPGREALDHIPNTDPPRVRIISDNPLYSPYEGTAEEVNIIGRIRWFAREI